MQFIDDMEVAEARERVLDESELARALQVSLLTAEAEAQSRVDAPNNNAAADSAAAAAADSKSSAAAAPSSVGAAANEDGSGAAVAADGAAADGEAELPAPSQAALTVQDFTDLCQGCPICLEPITGEPNAPLVVVRLALCCCAAAPCRVLR
jgi:hypothetical protein